MSEHAQLLPNGQVHPAAELFPMLPADELAELAQDIAANGLRHAIVLLPDGTLLDGRNRLAACGMAGVSPRFDTYHGDDPVTEVISLNVRRRHLTPGQRAAVAAEALPLYEAQALERKVEGGRKAAPGRPADKKHGADLPHLSPSVRAPRARDVAARAVGGVSGRAVQQFVRVRKHAPDLAEKVKAGTLALDAADKQAARRVNQKAEQDAREATLAAVPVDASGPGWRLLAGDFRERLLELPAGCVDLIVTDPPYPTEFLPLYGDLARIARHVLADDGICVVLTGTINLPAVIEQLQRHLTYGWVYVQPLPGSHSRIMGRHVLQTWKPWLAFTKNQWPSGRIDWHPDTLDPSYRAKDQYRWQQDPEPAKLLIDALCQEGGTVCDPFAGTGAYGVAALDMGRQFIGAELDAGRFDTARGKLCSTSSDAPIS